MEKRLRKQQIQPDAPTEAEESIEAPEERTDAPEDIQKIVEQAVERAVEKLRREAEERVNQARGEGRIEGERLAGMSEDERRRYEDGEREAELNRREAELAKRELRAQAVDELVARGLPGELGQLIDCTDAQSCAEGVDALERAFREAVQRGVDERIRRAHPLPRTDGGSQSIMIERMRSAAGLNH